MSKSGAAFRTLPDRCIRLKAVKLSISSIQAPWQRLKSTSTTDAKFGHLPGPCGRNSDASDGEDTRIAELHYAALTVVLCMTVSTVRSMYASREIAISRAVGTSACAAVLDDAAVHSVNEQGPLQSLLGKRIRYAELPTSQLSSFICSAWHGSLVHAYQSAGKPHDMLQVPHQ